MKIKNLLIFFKLSLLETFIFKSNLVESSHMKVYNLKNCDSQNSQNVNKTENLIFESCFMPMKQSMNLSNNSKLIT